MTQDLAENLAAAVERLKAEIEVERAERGKASEQVSRLRASEAELREQLRKEEQASGAEVARLKAEIQAERVARGAGPEVATLPDAAQRLEEEGKRRIEAERQRDSAGARVREMEEEHEQACSEVYEAVERASRLQEVAVKLQQKSEQADEMRGKLEQGLRVLRGEQEVLATAVEQLLAEAEQRHAEWEQADAQRLEKLRVCVICDEAMDGALMALCGEHRDGGGGDVVPGGRRRTPNTWPTTMLMSVLLFESMRMVGLWLSTLLVMSLVLALHMVRGYGARRVLNRKDSTAMWTSVMRLPSLLWTSVMQLPSLRALSPLTHGHAMCRGCFAQYAENEMDKMADSLCCGGARLRCPCWRTDLGGCESRLGLCQDACDGACHAARGFRGLGFRV